jgi:hypothetical protein
MAAKDTTPGAGMLKGSPFLLYCDWKGLADRPDFDLWEQSNKTRDILMRTSAIVLTDQALKKKVYPFKTKDDGSPLTNQEMIVSLHTRLVGLMRDYLEFAAVKGAEDWKNEYWIDLSDILEDLYFLQMNEELIETQAFEMYKFPAMKVDEKGVKSHL